MPIPNADGDGYDAMRERASTALRLNRELPGVEFKRGATWQSLWLRITKTVLAMSNLRDGGIVIVGRPTDNTAADGVGDPDLATYDVDVMQDCFDKYASSPITASVAWFTFAGQKYVVIEVAEFEEAPIICKREHPEGLVRTALYVRPMSGRPRTVEIESAEELSALLELAVEKRERRFERRAERAGFVRKAIDADLYKEEQGTLGDA